ncbi:hypothetical protein N7519_009528 [Penicillium mononematosum]|uniref:uncharacterized protein n=1 Tax=Penicillium mononematosum TaxID=268346 RepID=UPI0025488D5B|nr:uncharacterized protein N7519_009528 [Penicillium mononematosum]KAJ6179067.1 hypothetical protein N7519_009528 [Penicillium mononematosum]
MAAVLRGEREDLPLESTKKLQYIWGNDDERRSWEEIGLFKVFAKRESQHLGAHRPIGNFRFYGYC